MINIAYPLFSLTFLSLCYIIVLFYLKKEKLNGLQYNIPIVLPFLFIYFLGEYHFSIRPHLISFLFLGLSIYSLLKYLQKKENKYFIIFLISAIIIPMAHPILGFSFIGTIIIIFFVRYILTREEVYKLKSSWILLLIAALPTISWYFYNSASYQKLSFMITRAISTESTSVASRTFSLLNIGEFSFFELLSRGIILYLGRYLFIGLLIIFCLYLGYKYGKKYNKRFFSDSVLRELVFIILLMGILQLFLIIGPVTGHNPQRLINLNIIVFFLIPLVIILSLKIISFNRKTISIILLVVILSQVTSTMIIFPSPMIYQADSSLTINEINGMNWFDEHKSHLRVDGFQSQLVQRYYDFKNGFDVSDEKLLLRNNKYLITRVTNLSNMDRFFYDNYTFFPINDFYLVLTSAGVLPYLFIEKWQKTGRLYENDIENLNRDITVNNIYQSLNIDFYKTME